jgi:hypothetical protein
VMLDVWIDILKSAENGNLSRCSRNYPRLSPFPRAPEKRPPGRAR